MTKTMCITSLCYKEYLAPPWSVLPFNTICMFDISQSHMEANHHSLAWPDEDVVFRHEPQPHLIMCPMHLVQAYLGEQRHYADLRI
jgi:hypothetical protein